MFRFFSKNFTKISTFQKQLNLLSNHGNLQYYKIRAASTITSSATSSATSQATSNLDQIQQSSEVMSSTGLETSLQNVVDPPFIEIGLGGMWAPYSLIESCIESLHSFTGLPWWGTITLGTVLLRVITFPLFLNSKKYAIRTSNHSRKNQVIISECDIYYLN